MSKAFSLLLRLALVAGPAAAAELGPVVVTANTHSIPVRVSANTPELNALAQRAFAAHGRYHVVGGAYLYDLRFALVSPTSVQIDIAKSGAGAELAGADAFASAVISGSDARNALLRAADYAVEKTNGLGLHGFFGSQLAFIGAKAGRKEVYVSDLFFGAVRRITSDGTIALFPRWSPDGTRLLYTSYLHGFPDIFLLNLQSYQRNTFESFRGTNAGARFSPDGRRVAMVLTGSGNSEIWTSDAEGHGLIRRTHSDSAKASPCWSPDGARIVFTSEPGPQLYVMSAAGGYPSRLAGGFSGYCAEPDWSRANPDKIAFTTKAGRNFQLAVFEFSSGAAAIVSKAPFDGTQPSWLPDGRHLVYTASDASMSRLCILDTETGKSTPISPTSFGPAMEASVLAR